MKYSSTVVVPVTLLSAMGSKRGYGPSAERTGRQEQLCGHNWNNYKVFLRQFGPGLQLRDQESNRKQSSSAKQMWFLFFFGVSMNLLSCQSLDTELCLGKASPAARLKRWQRHECEICSWEGAYVSQHGACRATEHFVDNDSDEEHVNHRTKKKAIIKYPEVQHHNYSGRRSKQMAHTKKAADQMDSELIIIM